MVTNLSTKNFKTTSILFSDRQKTSVSSCDNLIPMMLQYSYVVAFQFGHQLVAHGNDEEIISLKETCVPRLKHLQSAKLSESMQTTQAHLHIPAIAEGKLQAIPYTLLTEVDIVSSVD